MPHPSPFTIFEATACDVLDILFFSPCHSLSHDVFSIALNYAAFSAP
jgi:hypothetical protein